MVEKILELKRILEISLKPSKINILHVASARKQVNWRKIVGIVERHYVSIARNLGT